MSDNSDDTFAKWFFGILAVVVIMWIFELGPFEESTPAPQPIVNSWNGSFTGHLSCNKCRCPGWQGGSNPYNQCGRRLSNGKICTHNYYDHNSPGE